MNDYVDAMARARLNPLLSPEVKEAIAASLKPLQEAVLASFAASTRRGPRDGFFFLDKEKPLVPQMLKIQSERAEAYYGPVEFFWLDSEQWARFVAEISRANPPSAFEWKEPGTVGVVMYGPTGDLFEVRQCPQW